MKAPVSMWHPQGVDGHPTFKNLTIGLAVLVGTAITYNVETDLRFVKKIYMTRFFGQKFYTLKVRKLDNFY